MVAIKPVLALSLLAGLVTPALSAAVKINPLGDSITGSPVWIFHVLLAVAYRP